MRKPVAGLAVPAQGASMALRDWILRHNRTDVESYRSLKQFIGYVGMLLPIACIAGGLTAVAHTVLGSISAYYHSDMRDVFVGHSPWPLQAATCAARRAEAG